MGAFIDRMIRAGKLDATLYEEVEADTQATREAMAVIVLSSVAAGIGFGRAGLGAAVLGVVFALIGWVVWAFLIYWIGTRLLPEPQTRADLGELLRTLGFANAPGVLRVVGVVGSPVREVVFLVILVWVLVATVIAVRQALDFRSTPRAVGVCVVGWIVQVLLLAVVAWLIGAPGSPAAS